MSRFSDLPKDILIKLLHTIDDDNMKKIQELEKRNQALESYKKLIRGMETDFITCGTCDKVEKQGGCSCYGCGDVFCLDCIVSERSIDGLLSRILCKDCYSSEESENASRDD